MLNKHLGVCSIMRVPSSGLYISSVMDIAQALSIINPQRLLQTAIGKDRNFAANASGCITVILRHFKQCCGITDVT